MTIQFSFVVDLHRFNQEAYLVSPLPHDYFSHHPTDWPTNVSSFFFHSCRFVSLTHFAWESNNVATRPCCASKPRRRRTRLPPEPATSHTSPDWPACASSHRPPPLTHLLLPQLRRRTQRTTLTVCTASRPPSNTRLYLVMPIPPRVTSRRLPPPPPSLTPHFRLKLRGLECNEAQRKMKKISLYRKYFPDIRIIFCKAGFCFRLLSG